jgi:hypothetical protein
MRSRSFRKPGCWLGLLAILMIALAPTVSRMLDARAGDASQAAPCDMPSMQHEASQDRSHAALPDTDACAYCSLLAHMPAVLAPPLVFALVTQAMLHRTAARFESALLIEPVRPGRPRAPPVVAS